MKERTAFLWKLGGTDTEVETDGVKDKKEYREFLVEFVETRCAAVRFCTSGSLGILCCRIAFWPS